MNSSSDRADAAARTLRNQKFRDIDEAIGYDSCMQNLNHADAGNFVVEFSDAEAQCATNLSTEEIKILLKSPRLPGAETRWINFWGGDLHQDSIEAIVGHYSISPRLIRLLCSKASNTYTNIRKRSESGTQAAQKLPNSTVNNRSPLKDAEKAPYMAARESPSRGRRLPIDLQKTHFGEIVDDIWHFCSVDWGHNYVHVGYNSLFYIPGLEVFSGPDKPTGKRIWTSLVLCADGTVISVSEKAFPNTADFYPEVLKVIRRNTLNVFHHLSKRSKIDSRQHDMMTINIRNFDGKAIENHRPGSLEHASLLFYYLFDDWITSYSLAARREHPYGDELEYLRHEMFEKANVRLVESLHRIGRQIAVLKRIYQSLELIINRILQRQRLLNGEASRNLGTPPNTSDSLNRVKDRCQSLESSSAILSSEMEFTSMGVRFSDSAIFRFERLLDRIGLYALSRIDEYLAEKDSLVTMNFNLIALKDSQATEKLTRVTVLLSKIAAIFLPLSLMTAYFSTQIADLQNIYTAKTYWLCFLVITILSIIFLIVFGLASDSFEGRTIYKSLTRIAWAETRRKKDLMKES